MACFPGARSRRAAIALVWVRRVPAPIPLRPATQPFLYRLIVPQVLQYNTAPYVRRTSYWPTYQNGFKKQKTLIPAMMLKVRLPGCLAAACHSGPVLGGTGVPLGWLPPARPILPGAAAPARFAAACEPRVHTERMLCCACHAFLPWPRGLFWNHAVLRPRPAAVVHQDRAQGCPRLCPDGGAGEGTTPPASTSPPLRPCCPACPVRRPTPPLPHALAACRCSVLFPWSCRRLASPTRTTSPAPRAWCTSQTR